MSKEELRFFFLMIAWKDAREFHQDKLNLVLKDY
jgi:hypothetical protein